jgi:hypothetical protein
MNNEQKLTLWLGATRYYLGRMSYAVSTFTSLLCQEWKNIPKQTQDLIMRDIEEEFARDDAYRELNRSTNFRPLGMDCDRASWELVRGLWKQEKKPTPINLKGQNWSV